MSGTDEVMKCGHKNHRYMAVDRCLDCEQKLIEELDSLRSRLAYKCKGCPGCPNDCPDMIDHLTVRAEAAEAKLLDEQLKTERMRKALEQILGMQNWVRFDVNHAIETARDALTKAPSDDSKEADAEFFLRGTEPKGGMMPDKDFKQEALRLAQKIVLHSNMTVPWAEEEIAQALSEAFKRGQIAAYSDAAERHVHGINMAKSDSFINSFGREIAHVVFVREKQSHEVYAAKASALKAKETNGK